MLEKFLKKSSWTDIIISIIFIMFGAFLFIKPEAVVSIISFILGGIALIIGILRLVDYYSGSRDNNYLLGIAILLIISGIVIVFCSDIILSVFRILIAIWIIYSGIMNLQTTVVWKELHSRLWLLSVILSFLTIIAGIYILINTGAILQTIGLIISVYGIVNIIENVIFMKKIESFK